MRIPMNGFPKGTDGLAVDSATFAPFIVFS
jgi:hypothetical protein